MTSTATVHRETIMIEVEKLSSERRFEEALARLDQFIDEHQASPELPDLKRTFAARRALLLGQAGRFSDALDAWNERAFQGLRYPSDAYEVALGRGTCYIGMGNPKEAVKILEVTLDRADPDHLSAIQTLLEKLNEAYSALKKPVPERWRTAAKRVNRSLSQESERHRPRLSLKSLVKRGTKSLRSP